MRLGLQVAGTVDLKKLLTMGANAFIFPFSGSETLLEANHLGADKNSSLFIGDERTCEGILWLRALDEKQSKLFLKNTSPMPGSEDGLE